MKTIPSDALLLHNQRVDATILVTLSLTIKTGPYAHMTYRDKFWRMTNACGDGCWMWLEKKDRKGYGQFGMGFIVVNAHRASFLSGKRRATP